MARASAPVAAVLVMLGLVACDPAATVVTPSKDPHTYYAELSLPAHAITLALVQPYDTLRLQLRALLGDGTPVEGTPHFSTVDTAITVDSSGLLTARVATTSPVVVRVQLTYDGRTRRDSAFVVVTSDVPASPVAHLHLSSPPGDSAFLANTLDGDVPMQLTVEALDHAGGVVPNVAFDLRSADTTVVTVNATGLVSKTSVGVTTIHARALAYGIFVHDSLRFRVGRTRAAQYVLRHLFEGDANSPLVQSEEVLRVGPGAYVSWKNFTPGQGYHPIPPIAGTAFDVVFDDPTNIAPSGFGCDSTLAPDLSVIGDCQDADPGVGGNIHPFLPVAVAIELEDAAGTTVYGFFNRQIATRRFPRPGRYTWHSTLVPSFHGTILVCEDTDPCKQ